jgi:hypothetical protein
MVLPTKHLPLNRSLFALGAELLVMLDEPRTVSGLWSMLQNRRKSGDETTLTFDWFVLSLDFLFVIGAVDFENNRVQRRAR